ELLTTVSRSPEAHQYRYARAMYFGAADKLERERRERGCWARLLSGKRNRAAKADISRPRQRLPNVKKSRPGRDAARLFGGVGAQDFFGKIILNPRPVAHRFKKSGAQQRFTAVAKLAADPLLHGRIGELALAGRLARQQLQHFIGGKLAGARIGQGNDAADLPGL